MNVPPNASIVMDLVPVTACQPDVLHDVVAKRWDPSTDRFEYARFPNCKVERGYHRGQPVLDGVPAGWRPLFAIRSSVDWAQKVQALEDLAKVRVECPGVFDDEAVG